MYPPQVYVVGASFGADACGAGMWTVDYFGLTNVVFFNAEAHAEITANDIAEGSLVARSIGNSVTEKVAPYFPANLMSGLYQHRFPIGLTLGATLQVVGRRSIDLQATRSMDPSAAVDLRADYTVVRPLTMTLTVNDSFNQAQTSWDRYVGGQSGSWYLIHGSEGVTRGNKP